MTSLIGAIARALTAATGHAVTVRGETASGPGQRPAKQPASQPCVPAPARPGGGCVPSPVRPSGGCVPAPATPPGGCVPPPRR